MPGLRETFDRAKKDGSSWKNQNIFERFLNALFKLRVESDKLDYNPKKDTFIDQNGNVKLPENKTDRESLLNAIEEINKREQ